MDYEECTVQWINRLNLQDWMIKLEPNCHPDDLALHNVCGETEWDEVNKCAIIRILDEKYYGNRLLPFDFEKILVHELLHIKFALLSNSENELQNRLVHQYIEELAKAFTYKKEN